VGQPPKSLGGVSIIGRRNMGGIGLVCCAGTPVELGLAFVRGG